MKKFKITDIQAEAILNLRLRNLRKLEEMEIKKERKELEAELAELKVILGDEKERRKVISKELGEIRKKFGKETELGARRTRIKGAPTATVIDIQAFVESEPITILASEKGWIRALKGYRDDLSDIKYKEGDEERFILKAKTTDKLLVFASNGKFYTIGCDKIQTGKGFGEPLTLLADIPPEAEVLSLDIFKAGTKYIVAASSGRGFIVPADEVVAQTKNGKQVVNLKEGEKAVVAREVAGDHVAVVGENRKLLIFSIDQLPEMNRGAGVALQKYKDGGLSDVKTFKKDEGLTWTQGKDRVRTESDIRAWLSLRATSGKMVPNGFPRNNKFQ